MLTRHILAELLKVMLLTCSVLVTVIAFGAAIRPLAEDLLGPLDLLKYIALAAVPMLQFALPFASGFAATMVLHRMVTDNELFAMSVSGLSYGRIFTPVLWLGVALALLMFVIVNFAAPRFWMLMRATATADVTRVFVNRISQGSAFEAGNLQIYADAIAEDVPDVDSGAVGRLRLGGVAAVQLDDAGRPITEFTAELATVDIYRDELGTFLKPALLNATVYRADDGTLAFLPTAAPEAVRLEDPVRHTLKFMTLTEILRLRRDVELFPKVRQPRMRLAQVLREAETWQRIADAFAAGRAVTLTDPLGRSAYVIEANRLSGRRLLPPAAGKVRITELVEGRAVRIAEATDASLNATYIGRDGERVAMDLIVPEASVRTIIEGDLGRRRWPARLTSLRLADEPGLELSILSMAALRERVPELVGAAGPSSELQVRANQHLNEFDLEVGKVRFEMVARLTQRIAVSVATPLVLLLGAILAAWRRNTVPLAIYALAFLPSIADILLIAGGEQMIKDGRLVAGLTIMWSGNVMLAAIVLWSWTRLRRN